MVMVVDVEIIKDCGRHAGGGHAGGGSVGLSCGVVTLNITVNVNAKQAVEATQ